MPPDPVTPAVSGIPCTTRLLDEQKQGFLCTVNGRQVKVNVSRRTLFGVSGQGIDDEALEKAAKGRPGQCHFWEHDAYNDGAFPIDRMLCRMPGYDGGFKELVAPRDAIAPEQITLQPPPSAPLEETKGAALTLRLMIRHMSSACEMIHIVPPADGRLHGTFRVGDVVYNYSTGTTRDGRQDRESVFIEDVGWIYNADVVTAFKRTVHQLRCR